ncbi:WYL domain-containing protein [Bacteroidia bacterium]|nr:WYL domain-containing protein [Bacteroidia bacterium]
MGKKTSKDSTSNLFNRYVWLVDIIYRRGRITFEEINEHWQRSSLNIDGEDIPLRTFHNHRKAIEQMFDVIIECDKRGGYKYYIENSDDMEQGGVRSWLLNTFSVNNLINESHKLKNRIQFEQIPSGQEYLTAIIEAMRDNLSIEITYQSYWKDTPSTFIIEPYFVKVFKQRWYVIAFSPGMDKMIIYALDRMQYLRTTSDKFEYPKSFDPREYYTSCFGIINNDDSKPFHVRIKTNESQAKYLRSLPLHHSQEEINIGDEFVVFQYYIQPTFDFRKELLSMGSEIEVIEPEWFRNEVKAIIQEMENMYSNKENVI